MEKLIEKSLNVLEEVCAKLFVSNKKETFVSFKIPNTAHIAVIKVTKNYYGEKRWRVAIGVMLEGYDKILETYSSAMDDEEVIQYIRNPRSKDEILKRIVELDEKADDSLDF